MNKKPKQRWVKKILKEVSLDEYVPEVVVESIFESPFEVLAKTIASAEKNKQETFKVVNIRYLGKFIPKNVSKFNKNGNARK